MDTTVVFWKWPPSDALTRPRTYTCEHVNAQLPSLKKNMVGSYQVVCITDETDGLDPKIHAIPMPCDDGLEDDEPRRFPRCFRKLWNFSWEARYKLGRRILSLDLDGFSVRSLRPVLERDENLVVLRNERLILGGVYLLTTGTYCNVWNEFDFVDSPGILRANKLPESDQGWLTYILPRSTPHFGPEVYVPPLGTYTGLPETAALVSFGTPEKPWMKAAQIRHPWIRDHYEVAHA